MTSAENKLREVIRRELRKEGRFLRFASPLIEKDPNGWSKEDQLKDDLISAYKWAFGKVWEKAKKLPKNDPQYKKLMDKMEALSAEIDKIYKTSVKKESVDSTAKLLLKFNDGAKKLIAQLSPIKKEDPKLYKDSIDKIKNLSKRVLNLTKDND